MATIPAFQPTENGLKSAAVAAKLTLTRPCSSLEAEQLPEASGIAGAISLSFFAFRLELELLSCHTRVDKRGFRFRSKFSCLDSLLSTQLDSVIYWTCNSGPLFRFGARRQRCSTDRCEDNVSHDFSEI
ncbi:hypothetical protein [Rhizobium sullae]|uniref:hypothetical protein n=1 Tax=Rhizobium sullae TaxID=50338 RepID=UPI00117B2E2D|nr:hypothetical protein [Rhizobium sullae]